MARHGKRKLLNNTRKNLLSGRSESTATLEDKEEGRFLLSLKYLDREQGQTLSEWEGSSILAKALETLRGYSSGSLLEGIDNDKFKVYGNFPPKEKTDFYHPKHIPPDARWARIHVNGLICLVGHVERNVFHLVFLDKDHNFWKSDKKHT